MSDFFCFRFAHKLQKFPQKKLQECLIFKISKKLQECLIFFV